MMSFATVYAIRIKNTCGQYGGEFFYFAGINQVGPAWRSDLVQSRQFASVELAESIVREIGCGEVVAVPAWAVAG
jgi:hypothetical protein